MENENKRKATTLVGVRKRSTKVRASGLVAKDDEQYGMVAMFHEMLQSKTTLGDILSMDAPKKLRFPGGTGDI